MVTHFELRKLHSGSLPAGLTFELRFRVVMSPSRVIEEEDVVDHKCALSVWGLLG